MKACLMKIYKKFQTKIISFKKKILIFISKINKIIIMQKQTNNKKNMKKKEKLQKHN